MSRVTRIAGSFAIVMVAYCLYALIAVPLIEPSFAAAQRGQITDQERQDAQSHAERRIAALAEFFPPGSWELDNPKILESDQVKLLIGEYTPQENGEVQLRPCTIVFIPGEPDEDPAQRRQKAILLQAPEGAILKFDQPFDLGGGKIGSLMGGRLIGKITIQGKGKPDDPTDDLMIVAQDVQLTEKDIWTPNPVQFRWGPHFGQGSQMHMRLLPSNEGGRLRRGARGPNIGGLESFELAHVDRLHLEVRDEGSTPQPNSAEKSASAAPAEKAAAGDPRAKQPKPTLPVEVTCQGPFVFNVPKQTASFEQRVSIVRMYPDGRNDQLDGDLLTIYFEPRPEKKPKPGAPAAAPPQVTAKAAPTEKKKTRVADLQARRIEAQGSPLVIRSPRNEVEAQGERLDLDLDLATNRISRILLEGQQPVFLRQKANQIETARIQYEPAQDPRRLGRVIAEGPGVLTGQMSEKPTDAFEARWNKELLVRPDEQNQVVSLTGGATLMYKAIGNMSAGEIHFFLKEVPDPKKKDGIQLQPDRMKADGNVRIDSAGNAKINSPQISAALEQAEIWFIRDATTPTAPPANAQAAAGGQAATNPNQNPAAQGQSALPEAPLQHFQLTGRKLQAEILLVGPEDKLEPKPSSLILTDNVELIETQTRNPTDKPTIIRGDQIKVRDASSASMWAIIVGQLAHFESQGLGLTGANITLNRGTNTVSTDGPGSMDLPPMDPDLEGNPVENAKPMRVDWRQGMTFDGRTVRFSGSVLAANELQQMQTDVLEVSFREMIRFDNVKEQMQPDRRPKVEKIACQGAVRVDSRSFDAGQPQSIETIEVKNLVVDNVSGQLKSDGPGRMTSWRLVRGNPVAIPGTPAPQTPPADPANPAAAKEQLNYLNVRFDGPITGNVLKGQRSMTFHDRVRTTYGPVNSWQDTLPDDNPDALGPEGAQLACDHLSVNQMPVPAGSPQSFELVAVGNTTVKGRDFTARGTRITYDQTKGMVVLEGDGRTDAFLAYQTAIGGKAEQLSAQRIEYRPATQTTPPEAKVSRPQMLEFQWGKEPKR